MTTVKSGKAKARRLQDFVRDEILSLFSLEKDTDVRSAIMGEPGVDIKLSKKAQSKFPYSVECKAYKSPQVYGWFDQASGNRYKGTNTLLVIKKDRVEPLVVITWKHFLELLE